LQRALGVAECAGAPVRGLSTDEIAVACEQSAEMNRGGAVPVVACAPVGSRGAHEVTLFFEQPAEARGAGGLASFVGAPIGNRGGRKISSLREEAAEVKCPVGVAPLVRPTISRLCPRQVAPSLEEQTNGRGGCRVAGLVCVKQRLLGRLQGPAILAVQVRSTRAADILALVGWRVESFIPHADGQLYNLE
jgi:hypothetical protein